MEDLVKAATDGSALGNPGPGGWAWWVNEGVFEAGGLPGPVTNQQMELTALLRLLAAYPDTPLVVYLDSRYTIDALTRWQFGWARNGWMTSGGKPVSNQDILRPLCEAWAGRHQAGLRTELTWVKGHSTHRGNQAADLLARTAATDARTHGRPIAVRP